MELVSNSLSILTIPPPFLYRPIPKFPAHFLISFFNVLLQKTKQTSEIKTLALKNVVQLLKVNYKHHKLQIWA